MKTFNLPDLGEGLADAEIREWFVKIGDEVKLDQPLVCVETAKAVVEVPSPQAGRIKTLYGKVGDIVKTHAPLIEFESVIDDAGSVVGSLEQSSKHLDESNVIIGSSVSAQQPNVQAMPAVRALAKQLQVDLSTIKPSGQQGQVTLDDVKKAAATNSHLGPTEPLHGVRRAMAAAMTQSQQEIVPVTLFDDADITDLPENSDITVRLIQAIVAAVKAEPALNAWYDGKNTSRRLLNNVNIGLAIDTTEGLFVPVIKDAEKRDSKDLRLAINAFKQSVQARTIATSDLQGATISLSNFGMIAGLYATPIVVPPMVAILACGRIRAVVMAQQGKTVIRRLIPLSLTFDHRAVTGGEATRFLGAVIKNLG